MFFAFGWNMGITDAGTHRGTRFTRGSAGANEWVIPKRVITRRTIAIIVVLAVVLAMGSVVVLFPSVILDRLGPAPVWHAFDGVFSGPSQLASEDCSLQNTQPILGGISGLQKLTPQSVVVCSFSGQTYQGVVGTDCNLVGTAPIPSVNGTYIPYEGCILSYAPLDFLFQGLFNVTSSSTRVSIPVYSSGTILANITTGTAWKEYKCSMSSDNQTKTNGPLACFYLGIPYSSTDLTTLCNFGTPIQVNGVPVPQGACMLPRSETRSG